MIDPQPALRTALEAARRDATPPPATAAATLFRIIDPLIRAMGYAARDVEPDGPPGPVAHPDRTLLPGTEQEWCLLAAAWGTDLDADTRILAARAHARSRGGRWMVVTHGLQWRLYDENQGGEAPASLPVAQALLTQADEIEAFLVALSKPAVLSQGLGNLAPHPRLAAVLSEVLQDEGSPAVRELCAAVRRIPELSRTTPSQIAEQFRNLGTAPIPAEKPTAATLPDQLPGADRDSTAGHGYANRDKFYLDFWGEFNQVLGETPGHRLAARKPQREHWTAWGVGRSGCAVGVSGSMRDSWIEVFLTIDDDDPKGRLEQLRRHAADITMEMGLPPGEELLWQDKPWARSASVCLRRPLLLRDKNQWPEALRWLADRLIVFERVFRPRLQGLPKAERAAGCDQERQ